MTPTTATAATPPRPRPISVPQMYINADPDAGTNPEGGIGGRPDSGSTPARR
ncbi:hypothetical protein [Streptomyces xanthochromogenes]|uniref:hypothetical protein n=1 Tax=Streptomyces xanthochromogenes TaxID=67384 RepID=UPI0037FE0E50